MYLLPTNTPAATTSNNRYQYNYQDNKIVKNTYIYIDIRYQQMFLFW